MESLQTEVTGTVATMAKCAHPDCICTVESGEQYCSDYCLASSRADSVMDVEGCNCGHPECGVGAHAVIPPLGTTAG